MFEAQVGATYLASEEDVQFSLLNRLASIPRTVLAMVHCGARFHRRMLEAKIEGVDLQAEQASLRRLGSAARAAVRIHRLRSAAKAKGRLAG